MSAARIVVLGFSDVGYACLDYLIRKGEQVVACYTYPDETPGARWPPSVSALAERAGIPVFFSVRWEDPREVEQLKMLSPDLLLSFYYRDLLPASVLALPSRGAYNIHGSLLPRFRGRAPVNWAIAEGETETGATLHAMVEKADAGDIVDSERVSIGPDDIAFEVQQRVVAAAVAILARQLEALKSGTAPRRRQNWMEGSYRGRRRPEDGRIDWTQPAGRVHNLVRAVSRPYPGAFTDVFGGKAFIWRTRLPGLAAHDAFPGQLIVESGRLFVCCGDDRYVEVLQLQPEGGPAMTAAEWVSSRPMYPSAPKAGGS